MEFPGITAGGGNAGTAGKSSSLKYGILDRIADSIEIVLRDGEIVRVSRAESANLFDGAAGAAGTLGIMNLLEMRLVEGKKYVKISYWRMPNVSKTINAIHAATSNTDYDYVDGVLFPEEHGVLVTGEMTNDKPKSSKVPTFSHRADSWFYLHGQKRALSMTCPAVDYVPLADYLFRYDRGGFWIGSSAISYFNFPFNHLTRWFLDELMYTRMLYKALHASGESTHHIVHDVGLPYATSEAFIDHTASSLGIRPLWLCPLRQSPAPTLHPHTNGTRKLTLDLDGRLTPEPMVNVGVWGFNPSDFKSFVAANRQLEQRLRECGTMMRLYAHAYYAEDEFCALYDWPWYETFCCKYYAETLPGLYEKVRVDVEAERRKRPEQLGWWLTAWWALEGASGACGKRSRVENASLLDG